MSQETEDQAPGLTVADRPDHHRFELLRGDELLGRVDYHWEGDRLSLDHTVVDRGRRERGLGSALARGVLDQLRERGVTALPRCPFLARYVAEHPEYADVVG